jgi:hypothetical protein
VATVFLGNVAVIEPYKPDPDVNEIKVRDRKDLGPRTTTFSLNETAPVRNPDGSLGPEETESRAMNLAMVRSLWPMQSRQPPAWVEGTDDLLVELIADEFGCKVGRPKTWKEG